MGLMLENRFRRLAAGNPVFPHVPVLKSVAAVGAYDAVIGGANTDSVLVTEVMDYLLRSGVAFDPDFTIDAVNFRENRDFLVEDTAYDMIIVCCIPAWLSRAMHVFTPSTLAALGHYPYRDVLGCALSPLHRERSWLDRARQSGAKLIITYGGFEEIGTRTFTGTGYNPPVMDFHQVFPSPLDFWGPGEKLPTRPNDLPLGWLGLSGEARYLQALAPTLTSKTTLGQQIAHTLTVQDNARPAHPTASRPGHANLTLVP